MTTLPGNWKAHEIEAYRAWQCGDPNRLLKACDRMIRSLARGFAQRYRVVERQVRGVQTHAPLL